MTSHLTVLRERKDMWKTKAWIMFGNCDVDLDDLDQLISDVWADGFQAGEQHKD